MRHGRGRHTRDAPHFTYRYFVGVSVLEILADDGRDGAREAVRVQRRHYSLVHDVVLRHENRGFHHHHINEIQLTLSEPLNKNLKAMI